nr:hypothetical protein [Angustibacter aerolatus]
MAEVTVRFWAAARAAAGTDRCTEQADSTAVLVERLQTRGPELTAVLARRLAARRRPRRPGRRAAARRTGRRGAPALRRRLTPPGRTHHLRPRTWQPCRDASRGCTGAAASNHDSHLGRGGATEAGPPSRHLRGATGPLRPREVAGSAARVAG